MSENFFSTLFFECPEKNVFNLSPTANIFGKNSGQKKFPAGIIGFHRAILADTPLIKRG